MRTRFLSAFSGVFFFLLLSSAAQAQTKGSLKFETINHDFGEIVEGNPVTFNFEFTNTGKAPIVLSNVQASCGCTTPVWIRTPIAPGEKSQIKVTYNASDHPGPFSKSIVATTDGEPSVYMLAIKGSVKPRPKTPAEMYPERFGNLGMESHEMNFGTLRSNARAQAILHLYNFGTTPVQILGFNAPAGFQIDADIKTIEPGQAALIKGTLTPANHNLFGDVSQQIIIKTSEAVQPQFKANAIIQEFFPTQTAEMLAKAPKAMVKESKIDLGPVKFGTTSNLEFKLRNGGKTTLYVRNLRPSCGCTSAKADRMEIAPKKTSTISGIFHADVVGKFEKSIELTTNDPTNTTINLIFTGEVIQ